MSDVQPSRTSVLPDNLSNIQNLLDRLMPSATEAFPFERELALFLLLVAALWPDDRQSLLTAARIFSVRIEFSCFKFEVECSFYLSRVQLNFNREFSKKKLDLFNKLFFNKIGGPNSLLFTRSVDDFHRDLRQRLAELLMMHDVINYLLKASIISPQLSSSTLAFHAIENNIFERANGYGVPGGAKRKRSKHQVTTVNSVREKWKRAPKTILLSFLMTRIFRVQDFSPNDPSFLVYLSIMARPSPGRTVANFLTLIQTSLRRNSPTQNQSIEKWTYFPMPQHFSGQIGGALRFSEDQLNRVLKITDGVFRRPLSAEQKDAIRRKNKSFITPITT